MLATDPSADARAALRHRLGLVAAILAGVLALGAAACALLAVAALEPGPRWPPGGAAQDPAAVRHLRTLARQHDPRVARPGRVQPVVLTAADLQLLAGQAARLLGGGGEVQLTRGTMALRLSVPVRPAGLPRWLNVQLWLGDGEPLPAVQALVVGPLRLPGWLAGPLLRTVLAAVDRGDTLGPPMHTMLRGVQVAPGRVLLRYAWRPDLPLRLAGWLLPADQLVRLGAYQARLATVVARQAGPVALPQLLQPVFALARERSAGGGDAAAENRAALQTLALYVNGRQVPGGLPGVADWPRPRLRTVVMAGRVDFPQHLMTSAALAATAGGPLADALGLAKEVSDARDGSGFSFNDLAVNLAGRRLGEQALADPVRLQSALAEGVTAEALMPPVDDLPEFLTEREFRRRYGSIGSPAYEAMAAEIRRRVDALPLLH